MKTKQEIENLKHQWCCDPCWDIEDTEGFEDHKEELEQYRHRMESKWKLQREEQINKSMAKKGITDINTFNYLVELEESIERLTERISKLEDKL